MLSLLLLLSAAFLAERGTVQISVRMERPDHHFYQVEMVFPKSRLTRREVKMATWTPGSYKIRDFAKNVARFEVFDTSGSPLHWSKTGKSTWVIASREDSAFKITYEVFADEHSVRTSYLDSFYGFINPASVFFYEVCPEDHRFEVEIIPWQSWAVSSPLKKIATHRYQASNWDELVDSPLQFGTFRRHNFDVNGIPHYWIIAGDVNMNETEMVRSITRIGETVGDIFGSYPFDKYYFFSQFRLDGARGGLEHRGSTMIQADGNQFRDKKGWNRFLRLLIHEYFHAWNVKAIHDKALERFDYQRENYTELLWLHEGWTAYYGDLLLTRAGFLDEKQTLKQWAKNIDAYLNTPGITYQSLADASFNAWIHQYQPSRTSTNSHVSYYSAGALSGLAIDLMIRHRTKNQYGLDQVMRALYQEFALKGKGIQWDDVVSVVDRIAGKAGREFFNLYISQPNPLPLETYLGYAGLNMVYVEDNEGSENGESSREEDYRVNPRVSMDIEIRDQDGRVYLDKVKRDGAGWRAGLDFDDELLAINQRRVTAKSYEDILRWSRPGDEVSVLISRANKVLTIQVKLAAARKKLKLVLDEDAGDLQTSIYKTLFQQPGTGNPN